MASNPTSSRKPRRRNWASEVARQEHSKERRRLARQAAERSTREEEHARASLRNAQSRMEQTEINKRVNSIANGLRPRLSAVMNSWGLTLPVDISTASRLNAWTDFKSIHVEYSTDTASKASVARYNKVPISEVPMRPEDQRRIAAEIRGLFYHEVGHNLATVPLPDLLAQAARDGWEPTTAGVSPLGDPTDPGGWSISLDFRHCWNALEDQRMEAWLVAESPQIAAYITVVVLERMTALEVRKGSWPLVAGRKYLPARVRAVSRNAFIHPTVTAEQVEQIVDTYRNATTAVEMVKAVEAYVAVAQELMSEGFSPIHTIDSHRIGGNPASPSDIEDQIRGTGEKIAKSDEETDEEADDAAAAGQDDAEDGDEQGGRPEGSDSDDAADEDEADEFTGGTGAGRGTYERTGNERPSVSNATKDALEDVMDDLQDDETLTDDVASINDAYAIDDGSLPTYCAQHENPDEALKEQARVIVDDIVRAFELVTADSAPTWQSQQRRGVLEAVRYHTRQPGDLEIFRAYSDNGDPGHNIAVSLFLDISGSMSGTDDTLGATAWAVKTACDSLGIECDVTLFDHMGYKLWGIHEMAPTTIPSLVPQGGTEPTGAFAALLDQERPHQHHIVLVMTDGAWTDPSSLVPYMHQNVYSMLFYYAAYMYGDGGPNPTLAARHGVNEAYSITDLAAIPQALEHLLMTLA